MRQIVISEGKLAKIMKETFRETLKEELMELKSSLLSFASSGEQKDIEKRYKNPSKKVAYTRNLNV